MVLCVEIINHPGPNTGEKIVTVCIIDNKLVNVTYMGHTCKTHIGHITSHLVHFQVKVGHVSVTNYVDFFFCYECISIAPFGKASYHFPWL